MQTNKVLIVANGEESLDFIKNIIENYDRIISVDGANNKLYELGIIPNVMVGDFDSIKKDILEFYKTKNIEFINLNTEKDFSDTHCAINYAIENNIKRADLVGSFGGRWDHSFANIGLLYYAYKNNLKLRIVSKNNEVMIIGEGEHFFKKKKNYYWSFFPLFEDIKISISGMKYNLNNKYVVQGDSLGLSNEFVDDAKITIHQGLALIVQSKYDKIVKGDLC